jgi:hypothetical protein
MSSQSRARVEQGRVVDIDPIRRNFLAAQLEHIGEWNVDGRPIVAGISDFAFADRARVTVPRTEQSVTAGPNRRKERRHSRMNRFATDDDRGIAESKLCIRSEKLYEAICIAGIHDRKHTLPPFSIGLKDLIIRNHGNIHAYSIRGEPTTY